MPDAIIIELNVAEWAKASKAMAFLIDGEKYRGMFRDTMPDMLEALAEYAADITHEETGNLADSFGWEYDSYRTRGRIFIKPNRPKYQRNYSPYNWAHIYGVYEHARGGEHAFFQRTVNENADIILLDGMRKMIKRLPQ